ncbi:Ribosomal large subunit pseudouridine synthase C [Tepidimonas alkaliphilus]|uniref:Pseudouridine synthase n=1 Tax=Tepidimonas alkaliphilus TaxID=2588942 RepID=A0A554W480_9BURK|nr:RluA family pseudouridine synthase [Tepidimonas alkaliphilus]TSE18379.1 Ribosomal large subunit pseudouridine synthase C [Tepidimonas alkaliphilus]
MNQPAPSVRYWTVEADCAGQRLDNYLLRRLKGAPKSLIYRVIRSGEVRLNQARARADARLHEGDRIRVPPLRLPETEQAPGAVHVPAREFEVLHEDEWLLALNKPAGVAVHGGSGVAYGVIEQLRQARPDLPMLELVHRLDRETSGVLLVAKKRSALRALQEQFRQRRIGKTYLALVQGAWPASRRLIDAPLQRYLRPDGERRVRVVAADDPQGLSAISLVRPLGSVQPPGSCGEAAALGSTLLAVTIKTGRTHQIRVHLAHAGHPIAGDDKYGDFAWNRALARCGLSRMFLHAWRLALQHPVDARRLTLQAPLPAELQQWGDVARFLD